jgi:hypothetical protein
VRSESMRLFDKGAHAEVYRYEQSPITACWLALVLLLTISVGRAVNRFANTEFGIKNEQQVKDPNTAPGEMADQIRELIFIILWSYVKGNYAQSYCVETCS